MDEQMQMRQAIDEKNNIKAQRQAQEKQRPPAPKPPSKPVAPAPTKAPTNLGERPKLVVGITVDQMRMDYLYRFWDAFGEGGLQADGRRWDLCAETTISATPRRTRDPGHASIYTGHPPPLPRHHRERLVRAGHRQRRFIALRTRPCRRSE